MGIRVCVYGCGWVRVGVGVWGCGGGGGGGGGGECVLCLLGEMVRSVLGSSWTSWCGRDPI